ncbi:unnamed protein product [Linum trigynum]|uniref:Uncharacterized protein n=1 Tax=Linum trigynum TaxID=586398 RepID=A0AAV2G5A1_9ROSI
MARARAGKAKARPCPRPCFAQVQPFKQIGAKGEGVPSFRETERYLERESDETESSSVFDRSPSPREPDLSLEKIRLSARSRLSSFTVWFPHLS